MIDWLEHRKWVTVLPRCMLDNVLKEMHDELWTGGHFGLTKTLAKLRERYFVKNAEKKVEKYTTLCRGYAREVRCGSEIPFVKGGSCLQLQRDSTSTVMHVELRRFIRAVRFPTQTRSGMTVDGLEIVSDGTRPPTGRGSPVDVPGEISALNVMNVGLMGPGARADSVSSFRRQTLRRFVRDLHSRGVLVNTWC
ncbi:hypothetical protein EVAR_61349_1 [Eumeta japonica]|uniref:Integrase zinc-binding domain-containing protein n=1 Tax=Eumeta variegata TaxID=151549 RepID=A0A4C1Y3L7_EUMVA|nr:hypothetical protein EVAR_61349_1 [Eumeta japonica]